MGKKILLAEDSLTIRKVFELAFAQTDISLTTVDNGTDAVRLAVETVPDLVVADVTLPGKDGFQVGEELRDSEKMKSCPILILAGSISPFDEDRFKKCGAAGVLFKPFESQEMLEKVQELLRGKEEVVQAEKGEAAPAADEPWDFSDVLDEATREDGKAAAPVVSPRGEDLLPGAPVQTASAEGGMPLGEFDVSLEEIEPAPPLVSHMEGDPFTDSPQAVTELPRPAEMIEEIEEIEDLDEVDAMLKEMDAAEPGVPAPPPVAPSASEDIGAFPPLPPSEFPAIESSPPSAIAEPPPAAPLPAGADPVFREQFAARANEIFEKVAAETVEKVLWEYMERFSAEFSAKVRESVEAVAWEVIPSTAEALIREEIARIREQTGKKTS
ncbi:MAG: response regulator [Deltaproteobacteria bacterium]|nr:response regulator [Deltaproteobacteria bacterium]